MIAYELDMTQQAFSKLEQREVIEDELLEKIANVVKVPVDALKNMSEDSTMNFINTFNDNSGHGFLYNNGDFNFNPIEKIVELYERLVKAEQEKVALLEKKLQEKQ